MWPMRSHGSTKFGNLFGEELSVPQRSGDGLFPAAPISDLSHFLGYWVSDFGTKPAFSGGTGWQSWPMLRRWGCEP